MSLSILPYVGSKRQDIKYFDEYLPKNITHIIEPFGGSAYLSLYLFSLNPKLKCIVNDVDYKLINFFNQVKKHSNLIVEGYNELISRNLSKIDFNKIIEEYKEETGSDIEKAILYLFYIKYYSLRPGMYPLNKKFNQIIMKDYDIFFKWIKNTEFILGDYSELFEKYKNNKKYYFFIDPPYFDSFNSTYMSYNSKNKTKIIQDNTKIFIDILDFLKKAKCKAMLIINKNAITEYIYKDYIVGEYNKLYQITKKETKHLIITNY